eukprot:CAMPEP_0174873504 /NCGR_PEP_ID=MMETSP1114-20130205/75033_1 /TAXON_ID=312471 /ORGANISM="Neobodo designis, Strain CCAP 1951/1" /LENGTH=83 /DNA_ID=CAMNT_0016108821 /DNA_START=78 /DNA_END=325 /DNA_ORIENTATION=-
MALATPETPGASPEAAFDAAVKEAESTHVRECNVALELLRERGRRLLTDELVGALFDDVFNNERQRRALRPFFLAGTVPSAAP